MRPRVLGGLERNLPGVGLTGAEGLRVGHGFMPVALLGASTFS